ncbi:hypothetical protein F5Y19DRAFT_239247 [Xylariaceae sp. FL1651]|nr:hypothetical protein F5Y19DRAFT_239247 [Xylariaceae sp. FL1651]
MRLSGNLLHILRATVVSRPRIPSVSRGLTSTLTQRTRVLMHSPLLQLSTSSRLSSSSSNSSVPFLPIMDSSTTTNPSTSTEAHQQQGSDGSQSLKVNGEGLRLDHLGPLIVNEDGTLGRIANWEKMADIEKDNAVRMVSRRNKLRLERLRTAQSGTEKDGTTAAEGERKDI